MDNKGLVGYKAETDGKTFQQYLTNLLAKHKATLSHGSFALVIQPPNTNFVYRVWTEDTGFEQWYNIAKNIKKPYVPKFLSRIFTITNMFVKRPSDANKIKILKIEKLSEANLDFDINYKSYELQSFSEFADFNSNVDKDILKILWEVGGILKSHNIPTKNFDTHSGNIMLRGKQYVITDPISVHNDAEIHKILDNDNILRTYEPRSSDTTRIQRHKGEVLLPFEVAKDSVTLWNDTNFYKQYNITVNQPKINESEAIVIAKGLIANSLYNRIPISKLFINICIYNFYNAFIVLLGNKNIDNLYDVTYEWLQDESSNTIALFAQNLRNTYLDKKTSKIVKDNIEMLNSLFKDMQYPDFLY